MAKTCTICGKGSYMATKRKLLRGNYNPTIKKRKYPNLQKKKINNKKVLVCASCIKAGKTLPR